MPLVPYINLHTHLPESRPDVVAMVNRPCLGGRLSSCGVHPWDVTATTSVVALASLSSLIISKDIDAVGECGLDKCCDAPFDKQRLIFFFQLQMASVARLPVIVHCVKAWSELLSIADSVENRPPIVVHGFRGKPELARELVLHGFLLSLGPKFNTDTLRSLRVGTFFLETDNDADADIVDLYQTVAAFKGVPLESLRYSLWTLWQSIATRRL